MIRRSLLIVAAAGMLAGPAASQQMPLPGDLTGPIEPFRPSESARHFDIRAVASHRTVTPGQTFHVALVGELDSNWVYYSPHPGPMVIGGSLDVEAAPLEVGAVRWPKDKPKTVDYGEGPVDNYVYTGRFAVYAEVTVPEDVAPGNYEIVLRPRGQICLEVCINLEGPEALSATATVDVGAEAVASPDWTADLAEGLADAVPAEKLKALHERAPAPGAGTTAAPGALAGEATALTFWAGIGLALLAGLTLNIMPCVLPIIPLRIYSLVNMAHESRRRYVTLGLAFAGGIVLFFVALAAVNVVLKTLGEATLDLNAHFQVPRVRVVIALVLVALSANLWGLFNVTVPSKVAGMEGGGTREGHLPAAGMGLMMAILSTPCSFWLMALALAWAQVQPLWLGTLAIVLIGVGMAVPHVFLAAVPGLTRRLPKPGIWMEYFKQTMGFLLVPAVLYLLATLPTRGGWPFRVAGFATALTFALWVWGSWVRYDAPLLRKALIRGPAVVLVVAMGLWLLPRPPKPLVTFESFDAQRIADAREEGEVVVVKVTAAWCTECKILDYQVFNTPEIAEAFERRGVVAVKADVTEGESAAARWVRRNVGGAPPLTILYPADGGEPRVVPGRFSKAELIAMLDEAAAP